MNSFCESTLPVASIRSLGGGKREAWGYGYGVRTIRNGKKMQQPRTKTSKQ